MNIRIDGWKRSATDEGIMDSLVIVRVIPERRAMREFGAMMHMIEIREIDYFTVSREEKS